MKFFKWIYNADKILKSNKRLMILIIAIYTCKNKFCLKNNRVRKFSWIALNQNKQNSEVPIYLK